MISQFDLAKHVIEPVLSRMDAWSPEAERLMLMTMVAESVYTASDQRLVQANGPALGIYQMEPNTHNDIWKNWLMMRKNRYMDAFREYLPAVAFRQVQAGMPPGSRHLIGNLYYATLMTRAHYLRVPNAIPHTDELLAQYHKDWYNSHLGKADPHHTVAKFRQLESGERVA